MKYKLIISFLCLVSLFSLGAKPAMAQSFDKEVFYAVMASGNMDRINTQLQIVRAVHLLRKMRMKALY